MPIIRFEHRGNFRNTERGLRNLSRLEMKNLLSQLGQEGVRALSAATPVESSKSANSWSYTVKSSRSSLSISWHNSNVTSGGVPVVILLQYGHGTGTGGYVRGRDFINPAIKPVFDRIDETLWKAVTSA